MTSFGEALIEARRSAGMQQKELAAAVKKEDGNPISAPYLNDLEHDRRQPPSDHIIEQLAAALKLPDPNLFYYLADRFPPHLRKHPEADSNNITGAYEAFFDFLNNYKKGRIKA